MEKPEPDVMSRRPRPPTEPFFTRQRGSHILIHGLIRGDRDLRTDSPMFLWELRLKVRR